MNKKMNKKITAIYMRVSSSPQSTRSQKPDLTKWVSAYANKSTKVCWYVDKASGKTMDRLNWNKLHKAIENNRVERLIVWRLDRLGRTASGLTKLFEELNKYKVKFISIREGIDLSTPAGRLIANVMASVANYEIEVGSERIRAGQAAAKAKGTKWGGSKKGVLRKHTMEQVQQIVKMREKGERVLVIARTVGVGRQDIYRILKRVKDGDIKLSA